MAASSPSSQNQQPLEKKPPAWAHLVGGGLGGTFGAILTSPLEIVKTRMQSSQYRHDKSAPRSLWKALSSLYRVEGARAMFRGLVPNLVGVAPSRAIYFFSYSKGKELCISLSGGQEGPLVHLAGATIAGVSAATLTNPLWLVKTRLQLENDALKKVKIPAAAPAIARARTAATTAAAAAAVAAAAPPSSSPPISLNFATSTLTAAQVQQRQESGLISSTWRCIRKVYQQEGVVGFYRGLTASYAGTLETAIQFLVYEQLKRMRASQKHSLQQTSGSGSESGTTLLVTDLEGSDSLLLDPMAPADKARAVRLQVPAREEPPAPKGKTASDFVEYMSIAGVSKLIASLSTYPHEVVRTRLRERPDSGAPRYKGFFDCLITVGKTEGFQGLYSGMPAHLVRVVPNTAIMFVTYELVLHFSAN